MKHKVTAIDTLIQASRFYNWVCKDKSSRKTYEMYDRYCQRATSSMGTVNKHSSHSPVGPWVCLCVFWVAWFIFMFMYVLFYLGHL